MNKNSQILGILTAIIGCFVILGWILDIQVMKSILPEFVTMKFNTALGFILSGVSLGIYNHPVYKYQKKVKVISIFLASIVICLGMITLIQYSYQIDLGIDQLFVQESYYAVNTYTPGRMAPNTAICFLGIGSSLVVANYKQYSLAQFLVTAIFLISLLGFVGYVFDISSLYYIQPFSGMALHTSISFLLLSIGMFLAISQEGWMRELTSEYLGGTLARNLIPLIVIFIIFNAGLFLAFTDKTNILNVDYGFILMSVVDILVLGTIAWFNARYINSIDRKNQYLQKQLKINNENLSVRVHERTQQLADTNQRLQKSCNQIFKIISTLPKMETALVASENKFRELAENIDEVFHINSADLTEILYISPGYEKVWGVSCESLYQNPGSWLNSVHENDQDNIKAACERLIQGKPLKEEYRIIRPNGSVRWISARSFPIFNQFGQISRHVGVATDITERKQIEIALKESEERYFSLIQATTQVIWTTDATGQFITPQDSWESFTGQSFSQHQGWKWQNALHPDDRELTKQIWLQALENRSLYEHECRIRNRDGEYKYFWVRAVPIINQNGSVREWIGACTDVTKQKQTELKIKKLNENLEFQVRERTSQLTSVNKELEAFAYSVSHDLRAPLRSIDGFSKTILERYADKLDDRGQHYLKRIRAGSKRMGELIDDLLSLSRVTRQEMEFTNVNLSAIAQEIAQQLSENEPQRQVEWAISPNLLVQGDSRLLRIALENLLNNAWKFTSKKKQANVKLYQLDYIGENRDYKTYVISDNGDGFDQAYVNKLFQAFQRLHSGDEFPGTGIGLATVKRIISRHGGDIWAEGVVTEGANFYFTLT
ncbi:MAG: PAS domain-containing protein [Sphaerospermopsis sp. SIO1G2]|nr:PAS domain-containing protein [Sphaerospermopsis sp. SIO1G2]